MCNRWCRRRKKLEWGYELHKVQTPNTPALEPCAIGRLRRRMQQGQKTASRVFIWKAPKFHHVKIAGSHDVRLDGS